MKTLLSPDGHGMVAINNQIRTDYNKFINVFFSKKPIPESTNEPKCRSRKTKTPINNLNFRKVCFTNYKKKIKYKTLPSHVPSLTNLNKLSLNLNIWISLSKKRRAKTLTKPLHTCSGFDDYLLFRMWRATPCLLHRFLRILNQDLIHLLSWWKMYWSCGIWCRFLISFIEK